jgi:hypothetical protein
MLDRLKAVFLHVVDVDFVIADKPHPVVFGLESGHAS